MVQEQLYEFLRHLHISQRKVKKEGRWLTVLQNQNKNIKNEEKSSMETNCAGSCNIPKLLLVIHAEEVSALNTSDKQVLFMLFQGFTHIVTALAHFLLSDILFLLLNTS